MDEVKACIFDLDGTLVDTEPYHFMAYRDVLARYGGILEKEDFIERWLCQGEGMGSFIFEKKLAVDADQARLEKSIRLLEILASVEIAVMPGVRKVLEWCDRWKIKKAIATGSKLNEARIMLDKVALKDQFFVILGHDSVKKNKPDPEIYLKSAEMLGVPVKNCLAFENTPIGIHSAVTAGMKCIAIPSNFTRKSDLSKAHATLKSLEDFSLIR